MVALAPWAMWGIPSGMSYLEGLSFAQIAGPTPERWVLANGLEVLYTQRPGIGLCTVQAWVRTGSAHEGKWEGSGISHYLEHMVFKGTGRFTNRELTESIHRSGGNSNAYTTFDRTVYYVDAPAEGFETAMEAISEMVFDPLITDADAKMEREVILREIAMRDDEHDSVLAENVLLETFRNHPMRHPIIGHKELFVRIAPDDLRAYHAGRYAPSNVVLAIGGSMDVEAVMASSERWFGRFNRRPVLEHVPAFEPPQGGVRRVELARDVATTKGVAAWRIPGFFAKHRMELDLFLGVLGSGNSSRLWDELREKRRLVDSIDAQAMGLSDVGVAWLGWIGNEQVDATAVEAAMMEVIDDLLQKGVSDAQFEKVRRQSVVAMVNGQKSIHSATSRFGYASCVGYDIGWPMRSVEQLAKVDVRDLTKVARDWLKPNSVTLATMHKKKAAVANAAVAVKQPSEAFEVVKLDNGIRVILQADDSIPKVGFGLFVEAGTAYEPADKRGLTGLLSTMFARDTIQHTRQEVAETVDRLGATFNDMSSQLTCGLWGEALSSDFATIAELVKNGVLYPKLLPDCFTQEKAAALTGCRESLDDIVEKARVKLLEQFFGDHPLAVDPMGTPETLSALTVGDVAALHRRIVVPDNMVIGISGNFDRKVVMDFVNQHFAVLPKKLFHASVLPAHAPKPANREKMEATGEQAVVCLAFPHSGFGPEAVTAANVTEELLSGMASGLFHRVREEKGLAYFVGATRVETRDLGMFYLYAGTASEATEQVVVEMKGELERLRNGEFKPNEIEDAKRRMRVARRQGRQSAGSRMQSAITRELVGMGANFDSEWERRMNLTNAKEVQAYVVKYLHSRFAQELIVTPKKV